MSELACEVPVWHFDSDLMIFSDGSLGQGFRLDGVDISTATNSTINDVVGNLRNLLSGSDEGLRLQIFYRLTPNVKGLIEKHKQTSKGESEAYKRVSKSRYGQLESNAEANRYYQPEIYLFVRGRSQQYKKQKFWEAEKKFCQLKKEQYEQHKEKFLRDARQIETAIGHAKIKPSKIKRDEWFNLLYEYFNLSRSEKHSCPQLRDINSPFTPSVASQFLLTDFDGDKEGIRIGDYTFKVVTLKTMPEGETYASMVETILKLPFHFWISQNMVIHDLKKEIERLQLQRRVTHSMASGSGNVSDIESESKLSELEELLRELLDGSEKIISTDFNVIVWGKCESELNDKTDEVLKAFKQMGQSEGVVETLPLRDVFLSSFPGSCKGLRLKKMKTSNCAHLMPVFSYWQGNKRPVCLLPNRDGVLFSLDPFAPELPNWNGLIIGGSGSGKSFTISQLMLMFYGQKPTPKIIWIDNGASSQKLLEVLGGEFIDLNINSKIRLNPFDLEIGETKPTTSKNKLILAVLETIFKDEDGKSLPKRDKALLEEAIFNTYQKCVDRIPTLSDYRKILQEHEEKKMNEYAQILYSWTGNTAYGEMLDGETNINLEKDLVTIEMKGLDIYPDLQNVFLLLLTDFIKNDAAKDLKRPTLLIIDEAWKLFETPSGLSFTIEAYRTFRKYNAGIWAISQNYRDFLSSPQIKNAVFPNTTSVFILRQRKIDWKEFQEAMDYSDAEVEAIKSLQMVKGKYSEFFYHQDENKALLRITPDPLSYWICTTDGNDKTAIEEMKQRFPDLSSIEILEKVAFKQKEVI